MSKESKIKTITDTLSFLTNSLFLVALTALIMMFAKLLFYMCIGVLINTAFVDSDDVNDELHQLIRKMQQKIDSLEAKDFSPCKIASPALPFFSQML